LRLNGHVCIAGLDVGTLIASAFVDP
jgi:hypothetical protein